MWLLENLKVTFVAHIIFLLFEHPFLIPYVQCKELTNSLPDSDLTHFCLTTVCPRYSAKSFY